MTPRAFLRTGAAFCLGFLCVWALLARLHTVVVHARDARETSLRAYRARTAQPAMLVLGDSRAAFGVRHRALPPGAFNWGFPGDTPYDVAVKARIALESGGVRTILLQADDHVFAYYRFSRADLARLLRLTDARTACAIYPCTPHSLLAGWLRNAQPLLDREERASLVNALWQMYATGSPRPRLAYDEFGDLTATGAMLWSAMTPEARLRQAEERVRAQVAQGIAYQALIDLYRGVIDDAHARGVRVIGVRYPLPDEYHLYAAQTRIDVVRRIMGELPFDGMLDYGDLYAGQPARFRDADHLTSAAGLDFTRRLRRDLEALPTSPLP